MWDPTWMLFAFALLHGLAAMLLLGIDLVRSPARVDPAGTPRTAAKLGEHAAPRRLRPRAEKQLLENLRRWRERSATGEDVPVAVDRCRPRRRKRLDRSVA